MAVLIRSIEAQQGLDVGGVPSTQVSTAVGQALSELGGTVSQAAQRHHENNMRMERMKNENTEFGLDEQFKQFRGSYEAKLADMRANMAPSGEGFARAAVDTFNQDAERFFRTIPRAFQGKYAPLLDTMRSGVIDRASAAEMDQRDKWFKQGIDDRTKELAGTVAQNGGSYQAALDEGRRQIDSSGLPAIARDAAKRDQEQQFQRALAANRIATDPESIVGSSGGAVSRLVAAVRHVESSGNPNAVSSKGAAGLMQVMPGTAREIAAELRDPNFKMAWNDASVQKYLKNPDVSMRYGSHYLNKMVKRFGGDEEAALVAYNAGPGVADKWINSGRNDAVLPSETRAYLGKVATAMGSAPHPSAQSGRDMPIITRHQAGRVSAPDMSGVNPVVIERFKSLQNVLGVSIPIVSGYRDPARNARAGGAKSSRHMHGDALDLDVSGMSTAERVAVIRAASSLGFTGVGVYANSLHLDTGNRRAWGPSHGSESVPDWAKQAIGEHLANAATLPEGKEGGVYLSPEFAALPLDERLGIREKALVAMKNRDAAAAAEAEAQRKSREGNLGLGIEQGQVSREDILGAGLDDATTAKLLRRHNERNKDDDASRAFLGSIEAGGGKVNVFDGNQTKVADRAYQYLERLAGGALTDEQTAAFVGGSGYIPSPLQARIRNRVETDNPQEMAKGLEWADAIERMAPKSFESMDGGQKVRDRLTLFRGYVNDLGMSGDEAARRVVSAQTPEAKATRESLDFQLNKNLNSLHVDQITSAFGYPFMRPEAGLTQRQSNALLREYQAEYRERFYETGGDDTAAKALAKQDILDRWDVTNISGDAAVMRYPPEKYYPALNGGFEYLREDALATATAWVAENYPDRKVLNVALAPSLNGETREDIQAKRPPRYRLIYSYEKDGQTITDEVWSGLWAIPAENLAARGREASDARGREFQAAHDTDSAMLDRDARANQAADSALAQQPGPDWMKARAAMFARERELAKPLQPELERTKVQADIDAMRDQLAVQRGEILQTSPGAAFTGVP